MQNKTDSVHALIYISTATHEFTEEELAELLQVSRKNNTPRGLTGLLIYKNMHFMQALEGPKEEVQALTERIKKDRRHVGFVTIIEEDIPERRFPDWSMGFANLASEEVRRIEGFSEFMNMPLTKEEFQNEPSRVRRLLMMFKKKLV